MIRCHCRFNGDLTTQEHRDHHREWEATTQPHVTAKTTHIDITEVIVKLDQLIAHAHGGPKPELTPGAQALLVRQAQEKNHHG